MGRWEDSNPSRPWACAQASSILANFTGTRLSAAPFGGWGWRYFDDPGVDRRFDPAGAPEGDFYLRLADGASSHQTNPASDGELIDLTAWMRGANPGAVVDVSIGFRDQNGGGEFHAPMAETVRTFALTTAWRPFRMAVRAPTDAPNPVYSARVTFTAGAGDTVEIDDAAIGPRPPASRTPESR